METAKFVRNNSTDLGLVIDDGSHKSSDIIRTFLLIFPLVKPGGTYIIEDLHASYWRDWEGGISNPNSSMQFLKLLADVVNFDHWGVGSHRSQLFELMESAGNLVKEETLSQVHSVLFLDSICVVKKKNENNLGLGVRVGAGTEEAVYPSLSQSISSRLGLPTEWEGGFSNPKDLNLNLMFSARRSIGDLEVRNSDLEVRNSDLENLYLQSKKSLSLMQESLSWRITTPLRTIRGKFLR